MRIPHGLQVCRTFGYAVCIAALLALAASSAFAQRTSAKPKSLMTTEQTTTASDVVFLLHGIGKGGYDMKPLARALRREGFTPVVWSYDSRRRTMTDVAEDLAAAAQKKSADHSRIHYVGHSMGGLIIRHATGLGAPQTGRIVMIGTPNNGAHLADRYAQWWLYRTFFGPAGQQLRTGENGLCVSAPIPGCEFAIIAGGFGHRVGLNPTIPGDNDGTVEVSSTRLPGAAEHLVLPYPHAMIHLMPRTCRSVVAFLKSGTFAPTSRPTAEVLPAAPPTSRP